MRQWTLRQRGTVLSALSALLIACGGESAPSAADLGSDDLTMQDEACLPLCEDRQCGDDGCGGTCGTCYSAWGGVAPELCLPDGQCCLQQCENKVCGDDGCGGSCGECEGYGECVAGSCQVTPGWTVLVYAMGDNDLEGSMFAQFNQLMTVGSNEHLNIVIQADYVQGTSGRPGNWKQKDLVTGQRLLVKKDEMVVLEEMDEFNSADPAELAAFIDWGVKNYPARRYALILDDHGGGYTGIGSDWTNNGWMPLPAIRAALEAGLLAAELDKFDILFYYACLMGNYEVAHNMAPYARTMLASEELAIGASFRLDKLQLARDNPEVDAQSLAWAMAEDYVTTWSKAYPDVTISLLDLEQLADFEAELAKLFETLEPKLDDIVGDLMVARHQSETFASLPFGFYSMQLIDFGGIFGGLAQRRPDLADAIAPVLARYEAMVVQSDAGPGHDGATGLSIFFPPSYDYYFGDNDNGAGKDYENAGPPALWRDFLVTILQHVTPADLGPQFGCFAGDENPVCQDQTGWVAEGADSFTLKRPVYLDTLEDDFAAAFVFAELPSYGMTQIDFYHQRPLEIAPETGMVEADYDYHRLVLHQGDKQSYAYWEMDQCGSQPQLRIPFTYLDPETEVLGRLEWHASLAPESWDVASSSWFELLEDDTLVPFEPGPEVKLYPAVLRMDMEWHTFSWEPLYTFFSAADPFTLTYEPIESCRAYLYGLVVEDDVGRSDLIFANVCKAEGEPKLKITVTVEADAEVAWDPSNEADFAITLTLGGEAIKFEPVPDSNKAVFELVIDYTRWMSGALKVREVDGNYHTDLLSKDITNRLYYADWFCNNGKKWTLQDVKDGPKTTIQLNISKCF